MRLDQLQPSPSSAEPIEIPLELMDSVNRHQADLAALVVNLRAAGLHEDLIEQNVRALMDSYAQELVVAIRGMIEVTHHG